MNVPGPTPWLRAVLTLSLALLVGAGCSGEGDQTQNRNAVATAAAEAVPDTEGATATGSTVALAGIEFTPPSAWRNLGASGMRKAQYTLPPVTGDTDAAEVNVYYFGPDSGGSVDANLERWIGQMKARGGAETERRDFQVAGMTAHLVAVNGSYDPGMSRPMGGSGEVRDGYRLVGIVVEAPDGNVFFKLTGPQATAEAMEQGLLRMVEGIHPAT